ncbi:MAG TPA: ADOP family duplicated permease [Gemmatimonadaceae bacterium]|nr:ADOP family duplicated permease [Gemmatimonadaceae bacterium]
MRSIAFVHRLWSNLVRRQQRDHDLDAELRAYVDLLAAEYERSGLAPDFARRRALVETGGIEAVKDATRDAWAGNALATFSREMRYALRTLRRAPGFLAIAVGTLALGIGGATAVFTVIKGSLLRPLPAAADPDRLVTIERVDPTTAASESGYPVFSYPDYLDLRARSTALSGIAGFDGTSLTVKDSSGSGREWVSFVTANFFTVLGVRPVAGRVFADPESENGVVLSYDLWQRRFGGSPRVIGSTITLSDQPYTVIGVAPRRFIGAMATHVMDIWVPIVVAGRRSPVLAGMDLESRRRGLMRLVGRLAPGKTVGDAQRDLATTAAWLAATHPSNRGRTVKVWAGAGMITEERQEMSRVPTLLAVAIGLLLLIACGNVATLSLIRVASRRRELATRVALGASRAGLVRQVVLEAAVIAVAAAVLGMLLARALVKSATLVQTVVSMSDLDLRIDPRVLTVAVVASTVTMLLISILPALHVMRLPPGAVLKEGGHVIRGRSLGQRALVAVQVAASLVLLAAAATIFATFQRVVAGHRSFDPNGLSDMSYELPPEWVNDPARRLTFQRALLARASAAPEVEGAAFGSSIPPFQWGSRTTIFRRGEEPAPSALIGREVELGIRVSVVEISQSFFDVMRISVLRGRAFRASDDERAQPVAIVNRTVAEALWPGRDPIGEWIAWPAVEGPARPPLQVVGMVADTRDVTLSDNRPMSMYLPYAQRPGSRPALIVRGRASTPVPHDALRRLVASVDPSVGVLGGRTLMDRLQSELRPQRTASAWVAAFGVIALLLAAIGLYGVVSQSVVQRTRELAIRSALGATPRGLFTTVLRDGMKPALTGAVVGALGVAGSLPLLRSLLSAHASDVRLGAIAIVVLALALLAATCVPAQRASRLDPAEVLRSD